MFPSVAEKDDIFSCYCMYATVLEKILTIKLLNIIKSCNLTFQEIKTFKEAQRTFYFTFHPISFMAIMALT